MNKMGEALLTRVLQMIIAGMPRDLKDYYIEFLDEQIDKLEDRDDDNTGLDDLAARTLREMLGVPDLPDEDEEDEEDDKPSTDSPIAGV